MTSHEPIGPAWVTCASLIKGSDGSLFRVPCTQLQAVCVGTVKTSSHQTAPCCGFQCLRCFQIFQGPVGLNPDWRPLFTLDQILPIMPLHRVVIQAKHILQPFPTDPTVPVWVPPAGHYCQAVHLVDTGNQIMARCSTCGQCHPLLEAYYPVLRQLPGPLVPAASILFAFQHLDALGPPPPCAFRMQPHPTLTSPTVPAPAETMTPPSPPVNVRHRVHRRKLKPVIKPDPKPVQKSDPKPVVKPVVKSVQKPDLKPVQKSASQPVQKLVPLNWDTPCVRQPPRKQRGCRPKAKATPPRRPPQKQAPKERGPSEWTPVLPKRGTRRSAPVVSKSRPKVVTQPKPKVAVKASASQGPVVRPKKSKKPKKPKQPKKPAVNTMAMDQFTQLLASFKAADAREEQRFTQDDARLDLALQYRRQCLLRKTFSALKHEAARYRDTHSPLYPATSAMTIMAGLLDYSYRRLCSAEFQVMYKVVEAARQSKDAALVGDLPVQGINLRQTEWFNPATYLWTYFEVLCTIKLRAYHSGNLIDMQDAFPKHRCHAAASCTEAVEFKTRDDDAEVVDLKLDFNTYGCSRFISAVTLPVPAVLIKHLGSFQYTHRQIVGFVLLHLRRLFDRLMTTRDLRLFDQFDLYAYIPDEADLPGAMAILLLSPPHILRFSRNWDIALAGTWLDVAVHFAPLALKHQCLDHIMTRPILYTTVQTLTRTHSTIGIATVLNAASAFGFDMGAIAPILRGLDYLGYVTARIMRVLARGYASISTVQAREFAAMAVRTIHAAHAHVCAERVVTDKNRDNAKDQARKFVLVSSGSLHCLFQKGSSQTVDSLRRSYLLDLLRIGGDPARNLVKFWLGAHGSPLSDCLDGFAWLVRYYGAYYSNDDTATHEVHTTRYYWADAPTRPPLLHRRIQAFDQYQRALLVCQQELSHVRSFFVTYRAEHERSKIPITRGRHLSWADLFEQVRQYLHSFQNATDTDSDSDTFQGASESVLFTAWLCSYILGANASDLNPLQFICAVESWVQVSDAQRRDIRQMIATWFQSLRQLLEGLEVWVTSPALPAYRHLSKPPTILARVLDKCKALHSFLQCLLQRDEPTCESLDTPQTRLASASRVVRAHLWPV